MVLVPHEIRDRVLGKPSDYTLLGLYVPFVIGLEGSPLVRSVLRKIPGPTAIHLRRLAWYAEVTYQVLSLCHLLGIQIERLSDSFK